MERVAYDHARFDEGYYTRGERGGFDNYEYDTRQQWEQLQNKWGLCDQVPHQSALFVGCARGFEVAWWREHGKRACGVDVSRWAIENAHPAAKDGVALYDGVHLPFDTDAFDLVAAFDVLTLVPAGDIEQLTAEMVRVAGQGIVFRSIVKNWYNLATQVDGTDGVSFVYKRFEEWDKLFTQSGKFRLHEAKLHAQYETNFIYTLCQPL